MSATAPHDVDVPVVRLHLRSTLEHVDWVAIENYCIQPDGEGWAGVGWGLWGDERPGISWQDYNRFKVEQGEPVVDSVRRLHDLPLGALVWSRRRDGTYWLGQITGEWLYADRDETRRLDLFNLRPCRWWLVGTEDAVPGKIVNNFRARIALNPVRDHTAVLYSRRLRDQFQGEAAAPEPIDPKAVVESLLGATDLEDLVAVYLQDRHGLILVSRGRSTPGYEYVLRSRGDGRRAVASVKSGTTPVDLDRLPREDDVDVWAYAVSGKGAGVARDDVRWINTKDLADFMIERSVVLPENVARWLKA